MTTALDVARYFISLDQSNEDDGISNLKLQKLVYYAQGISLAITGDALFKDDIEAWTHGPVCPSVYHQYKQFGSAPIVVDVELGDLCLTDEQKELLNEVYDVFGQFSAWKLRNMTHEEAPWIKHEHHAGVIPHEDMKEYFLTRVN